MNTSCKCRGHGESVILRPSPCCVCSSLFGVPRRRHDAGRLHFIHADLQELLVHGHFSVITDSSSSVAVGEGGKKAAQRTKTLKLRTLDIGWEVLSDSTSPCGYDAVESGVGESKLYRLTCKYVALGLATEGRCPWQALNPCLTSSNPNGLAIED